MRPAPLASVPSCFTGFTSSAVLCRRHVYSRALRNLYLLLISGRLSPFYLPLVAPFDALAVVL